MTKLTDATSLDVHDFGSIKLMVMPPGWNSPPQFGPSTSPSETMIFYSPTSSDVNIRLILSCPPVRSKSQTALASLLQQPSHVLLPSEIQAIKGSLRGADSPDEFKALNIGTEVWNGKMSLALSGRWLADHSSLFWLMVDCGTCMQELIFSAPTDLYSEYSAAALSALKSIIWNDIVD